MRISTTLSAPYGHILRVNILRHDFRQLFRIYQFLLSSRILHGTLKICILLPANWGIYERVKWQHVSLYLLAVTSLTDLKVCFIFVQKKFCFLTDTIRTFEINPKNAFSTNFLGNLTDDHFSKRNDCKCMLLCLCIVSNLPL